jgi:lipoate-protein ligase A
VSAPRDEDVIPWHLIVERSGRPGWENMATDMALLRHAASGHAALRLYRWAPPCLSFGRNEPVSTRYDLSLIRALGLDVVRRPTGGRAVWHDAELTYAVAGPSAMFGSLNDTYLAIHRMLAHGLTLLGVKAEIAPRPSGPLPGVGAGACFASPAGGEIVVDGRKLVGSAQLRLGDAFLQHGSLLLENAQDVVARVTRGPAVPPAATSLADVLGQPVAFDHVAAALTEAAQADWTGPWTTTEVTLSADDIAHFKDSSWIGRR